MPVRFELSQARVVATSLIDRGLSSAFNAISCGGKRSSSRQRAIIRGRCSMNRSPIASQAPDSSCALSGVFFVPAEMVALDVGIGWGWDFSRIPR